MSIVKKRKKKSFILEEAQEAVEMDEESEKENLDPEDGEMAALLRDEPPSQAQPTPPWEDEDLDEFEESSEPSRKKQKPEGDEINSTTSEDRFNEDNELNISQRSVIKIE